MTGLLPGTGGGPPGEADDASFEGIEGLRIGSVGGTVGVLAPESKVGLFKPDPGGVGWGVGREELGLVERSG